MKLPDISHLQFLILNALVDGELSGQQVRDELNKYGIQKSGPAFYQLMGRLEDAKLVNGWYRQRRIDAQAIKERHYRLTAPGRKAHEQTTSFYSTQLLAHGGLAYGGGR